MTLEEILTLDNEELFKIQHDLIAAALVQEALILVGIPCEQSDRRDELEEQLTQQVGLFAVTSIVAALLDDLPEEQKVKTYVKSGEIFRAVLRLTVAGMELQVKPESKK